LKLIALAPVNSVPLIVTAAPIDAADGDTTVIVGGAANSVPVNVINEPVDERPPTDAIPVEELEVVVNWVVQAVGTATSEVARRMLFALIVVPRVAASKL
jgi:hypothetical protein